jgi:hypothetical protein
MFFIWILKVDPNLSVPREQEFCIWILIVDPNLLVPRESFVFGL